MAQAVCSLQRPPLHRRGILTITASLLGILALSLAPCAIAAATPGYGTANLALGKPVTPLTGTVLGSIAGVNDGASSGYWYSFDYTTCTFLQVCTETDSQGYYYTSFTIDLQAIYSIGRIDIYPLQTRGLRVFSSLNGTDWTEQHQLDGFDTTALKTAIIGSVSFEPKGAYTARYLKYQGWAWWDQYVGIDEFAVYEWKADIAPQPSIGSLPDLAAGQQAVNSGGTVTAGHDAFPNLTDGDPFTWWQPVYYFDNCQYVYDNSICPTGTWYNDYGGAYVDLGASKPVQAIRLTFPTDVPATQSYIVDVSDDINNATFKWWSFGGDPKVIASLPAVTNAATRTFYLPNSVSARYVWVSLNNWTTSQPLLPGLAEIEVYGALPETSTYTISASADPNGIIAPSGSVTVNAGSDQSFNITSHTGYNVNVVRVDGVPVGSVTSYTFPSVAADHTISATFSASSTGTTPTVTVTPNAPGITTLQALMVTVAVSGGAEKPTPTGTVTLTSGSYTSAVTSLASGQTIVTIPAGALAVGNDTLTATYSPDSSSPTYTSATGTALVTVTPAPPVATLSSASLSFSAIVGATSAVQTVQLSNSGGSALAITSISLSGTGASAFAQSSNCGGSLAAGSSCNIPVTFSPNSAANYSATLSVVDNAAGSPHTVSLSGAGIAFTVAASPAAQTTLPGSAAAFTITVASQNGTFSNAVALAASGMPAGSAVAFAPASVTPGSSSANSTLTIQVPWATASVERKSGMPWPLAAPVLALLLPFVGRLRRVNQRLRRMISLFLLVAAGASALAGLTGCSFTTGYFGQRQRSYTVTVTGTSGTLTRSPH